MEIIAIHLLQCLLAHNSLTLYRSFEINRRSACRGGHTFRLLRLVTCQRQPERPPGKPSSPANPPDLAAMLNAQSAKCWLPWKCFAVIYLDWSTGDKRGTACQAKTFTADGLSVSLCMVSILMKMNTRKSSKSSNSAACSPRAVRAASMYGSPSFS